MNQIIFNTKIYLSGIFMSSLKIPPQYGVSSHPIISTVKNYAPQHLDV